jgi:ABC-type multidrug transport system permease subunit
VRSARLLLAKDLRVLRRSPLLLGVLVSYPLLIAVLLALVAGYANAKPRIAFVDDDHLPEVVEVGGRRFHIERTIERVSDDVTLVRLDRDEAERQLRNGKVVAVVRVPPGFLAQLKAMSRSPVLELETTRGLLASRVTQQMQALVYSLNRELQGAFIDANLQYVDLILHGGTGEFLGRRFEVLGLERAQERVTDPEVREFVGVAQLALDQTDDALRATANPIELSTGSTIRRTWALSAQVQAHALALVTIFLAAVLAAAALAAERDERVLPRLTRGLASLGEVLTAKVALSSALAAALGIGVAVAFGVAVEAARVEGGEPWARVPALVPALLLAGTAAASLGALVATLAREARAATLVSVLLVLPIVFLGVVPREAAPAAGWVSDALPFAHAVRLFDALLYETSPWSRAGAEAAWLAGIGVALFAAARLLMRRLTA